MVNTRRSVLVNAQNETVSPLLLKKSPGRTSYRIQTRTAKKGHTLEGCFESQDEKESVGSGKRSLSPEDDEEQQNRSSPEKRSRNTKTGKAAKERLPSPSPSPTSSSSSQSSRESDSKVLEELLEVKPLQGREKEFGQLRDWIEESVRVEEPLTIYVSGTPGTGKTATIQLVLKDLKQRISLQSVLVNCTRLRSSGDVCSAIMERLKKPTTLSSSSAAFSSLVSSLSSPLLLVLDEADFVSPAALSSLFCLPDTVSPHLIVMGIANTIDFTERVLKKVKLRTQPRKLVFGKYSRDQLKHILTEKINEHTPGTPMNTQAVELCARKVAAVSGDVRMVVQLARQSCKRAARGEAGEGEAAATPLRPESALRAIGQVYAGVYSSPLSRARLPLQSRVLLAVCLSLSTRRQAKLTRQELLAAYSKVCISMGWPRAEGDDLSMALDMLQAQSFFSIQGQLIRLQVDTDTAKAVIVDEDMLSKIENLKL